MFRSFIVFVFLIQVACASAESVYVCPAEIDTSWHISSPPQGWETLNSDAKTNVRHQLDYATFTDGHPRELAFLRPAREESTSDERGEFSTSIYEFTGVSPDGIWLVCGYSDTPAIIMKRLSATHKSCRVKYSQDIPVQSISCE